MKHAVIIADVYFLLGLLFLVLAIPLTYLFFNRFLKNAINRQKGNVREESEQKFRQYLERITSSYIAFDKDWRCIYVNRKASKVWNREPEDMVGKVFWEEFPNAVGGDFYRALHRARETGQYTYQEEYYKPWDTWFADFIYPDEDGVSVFFHDITQQKASERAIAESQQQLQLIYNATKEMMTLARNDANKHYIIESVNNPFLQMVQQTHPEITREKLVDTHLHDLLPDTILIDKPEAHARTMELIQWAAQQKEKVKFDLHNFLDGKVLAYEILVTPIVDAGGETSHLLLAISDQTDNLYEAEKMFITINKAVESERIRIAGELHDSLTQTLSVASLNLKNLSYDFPLIKDQQKYHKALQYLEAGIEESRSIAHRIMPKAIRDFGLIPSIGELIENSKQLHQGEIRFSYNRIVRLSDEFELNLFRIVQQALSNAMVHAKAQQIEIELLIEDSHIQLRIKDDGVGFVQETVSSTFDGIGIRTMRSRAIQLGGVLSIDSRTHEGTLITLTIPLTLKLPEDGIQD